MPTNKKKFRKKKGKREDKEKDDESGNTKPASTKPPKKLSNKYTQKALAQAEYERNRAEGFSDDDEFQTGADKIQLNRGESDSESDDEKYAKAVTDSDEDDEDDEDDKAEEQEEFQEKVSRMTKDEENTSKAWGKKKKDFYGADTSAYEVMGEDEQETIEQEEKESRRLQAEAVEGVREEDVDASNVLESIIAAEKSGKTGKTKAKAKATSQEGEDLLGALKHDLSDLRESGQIEKLSKDVAAMTTSEKKELLVVENPELLPLLDEVKPVLEELQKRLHPLITKVHEQKLPTSEGLSFLELKYQLLLTYCTNLCFYLLLKSEGKPVKNHPVIKQLASLRVIMEKMRSIDSKLKYQVDKLLKTAALGPDHQASTQDPLSYRPDPGALVPKVDKESDGVYQAPRMTAVQFDEDEKRAEKRKAQKEKARLKAEKSSYLADLRTEIFADRPEEIKSTGGMKKPSFLEEREKFEEDSFVRLTETKADKKKRLAAQRIAVAEDLDFDDFGDLHGLTEAAEESKYGSKYDKIAEKKKNKKFEAEEPAWTISPEDVAKGEEFYEERKVKTQKRKQEQKAEHPNRVYSYGAVDPDIGEEGARREAGKKIVQNRGLTRIRPKKTHNPRSAKRLKFDEVMKKRRSTVQEYKGKQPNYGGEASGLKTDVIKSTRLS